ncbi:MAG: hypothetical protein FWF46_02920 [Oscillospiraceae bacterium]|nr:hypothetical protein [Oscillospiraceae bacterium]
MNQYQEKFFSFIMDRVQDEKKAEAKELLNESFAKQNNGTFNKEYMQSVMSKIIAMLKPEHVDEVKNIMMQFGKKM